MIEQSYLRETDEITKNILQQWAISFRNAVGRGDLLSEALPICYNDGKILPRKNSNGNLISYTKPILLLINELDYSGADLFPAVLSDWGVVTTFGTETVGAGGNVIDANYIGNSEMTIRLTQSLMYREREVTAPNGVRTHYIENVGVTPDIEYETTMEDYRDGFRRYRDVVSQAVLNLIGARDSTTTTQQ